MLRASASALPWFIGLYAALFAAFGVASPFLPGLLQERRLHPAAIGFVLGLGSAIRLVSGPLGGRLADRTGSARGVLAAGLAASAAVALGYVPATGLLPLALIVVAHATLLAPLTPIADALTMGASEGAPSGGKPGFDYGWVRGTGSAAFIVATAASGQAVGWAGVGVIIWLNAALLAVAAILATRVPNRAPGPAGPEASGRFVDLLRIPAFTRLMVVAALIGGSHALHDGFEVIRWRAAGMSPGMAGLLWAESVGAEVLMFLVLGRPIIARLGVAGAAMLAAVAGIVRWGTAAQTAAVGAMALVEPLHGLTFALLHLVCVRTIAAVVPAPLASTAQAFYGTVAVGTATTVMTFASGPLYAHFGAAAFWVMAGLCTLALPLAWRLNDGPHASGAIAELTRGR